MTVQIPNQNLNGRLRLHALSTERNYLKIPQELHSYGPYYKTSWFQSAAFPTNVTQETR